MREERLDPDGYAYLQAGALVDAETSLTRAFSAGVLEVRELADRPHDGQLVEDSRRIAELLGL